MKKFFALIFCLSLFWNIGTAQTPSAFKYQAVVRTNLGQIIVNQQVGFRISILKTSTTGTSVYSEKQTAQTNTFGLVTFEIGRGTVVSGTFASINWGSDAYFVKIELDATNSGTFTDIGTSQLLSVPYALYAAKAGNGFSGIYTDLTGKPTLSSVASTGSYTDLTNKPTLFSGSYNDLTNKPNIISTATTPKAGDVLYHNGTSWQLLSKGSDNQVLKLSSGLPAWKPVSDLATAIPVAIFTVSNLLASTAQSVAVDASGCVDDADLVTALQVRWKWEDAGAFTAWSTTKTASNTYLTEGSKNITLEVKDTQGNVGTVSKAIVINNNQFLPVVFTGGASNITTSTATCAGNVVTDGGTTVTARGVCWSTVQNPTIADFKTSDGTGLGYYTSSMTGLVAGTTYYVRAYATNSIATNYSNQITVQAVLTVVIPTVTTTEATNITSSAATTGGNVTATGGADITARGVCWSINQNPTIADSKTTDGTGSGSYPSQINGLASGTYYARAYATNSAGTGYGTPQITIITTKIIPELTTKDITEISAMGCVSGGTITTVGNGTISEWGICFSESPNPTIADYKTISPAITLSFVAAITRAKPSTTYYLRAYATNEIGTGYGDQKTYKTSDAAYYQSFESGLLPIGWSGDWKVINEAAFDGGYSLTSLDRTSSRMYFNYTFNSNCQLSFFYAFNVGNSIDISIDDVMIQRLYNNPGGWQQYLINITPGTHKIIWAFNPTDWGTGGWGGHCFIDQILITK